MESNPTPQMAMPRYRCHKVVSALRIKNAIWARGGSQLEIVPEEEGFAPIVLTDSGVIARFARNVMVGGYYVVYADGYVSFSPAKAFQEGYTRITTDQEQAPRSDRHAGAITDMLERQPPVTIGRMVRYVLSAGDAEKINRCRTTGVSIAERISSGSWPIGAQAHIGLTVEQGRTFPALVVAATGSLIRPKHRVVNLQVFLDGNDVFWAQSIYQATGDFPELEFGAWHWPPEL